MWDFTAVYEEIGQMEDWVQRIRELRAAYAAASVPEGQWLVSVAKGQPRNLAYEPQPEEFARLWAKEQWDQYKLDRRQTKKLRSTPLLNPGSGLLEAAWRPEGPPRGRRREVPGDGS